jgi:hypothetical protein
MREAKILRVAIVIPIPIRNPNPRETYEKGNPTVKKGNILFL